MPPNYPSSPIFNLLAAEFLIEQKSLDEAAKILQPAYDWIHQKTDPKGYMTGLVDGVQGELLTAQGKPGEAEPLLVASLENFASRAAIIIAWPVRRTGLSDSTGSSGATTMPSELPTCSGPTRLRRPKRNNHRPLFGYPPRVIA